jgi:hypothetical protein
MARSPFHYIPFLLGFLFFLSHGHNGLLAQKDVQITPFDTPPQIDGLLDEETWNKAEPVTDFIQREPNIGQPFSEKTEVYVGYDKDYLYIGFRCFGNPEMITAKELARDVSLGYDDRVQVILDTYLDKRNAYWFQVGPRGSIGDAIVSENGAAFNKAWDGLWTGKAKIHDRGWDAEIAIPFKTLSFRKGQDTWGIKFIRRLMRNEESGYWPEANLDSYAFQVSDAGLLTGIGEISQGVGLDLVPYGLTGADYKHDDGKTKPVFDAGFDAYYRITSNLKAALTVNTDFAQTEVDDQQINLTRFDLFYPEKRDFFLDGENYFNFGINGDRENLWNTRLIPFFSRRIGLDSLGNPIPLLYGGKITGQAGKWNIGAMYMKDDREDWQHSHFVVTRLTRNFGDQSQAGLITTFGNSLYDTSNYVVGFDVKLGTSKFMGNKNVAMILYGLKSQTGVHDPEWQDRKRDLAFGAEFLYPNDFLFIRLGHMQIQENFIAGIGFVPRPGVRTTYGWVRVGPRPERWGIMQVLSGVGGEYITDFSNVLLTGVIHAIPLDVRFFSGDRFQYTIAPTFEKLYESFNIYEDHVIPAGDHNFIWQEVTLTSAQRRILWGSLGYRFGGFFNGTRKELSVKGGYKIVVPLFVGGELIRSDVKLPESSFIATIYRLNLNILFNPDITLYSFIQYDSESGKMGWQSRFQWILQPGKEIFLVWNSIASDPYDRFQMQEASVRLKVKYTIRF